MIDPGMPVAIDTSLVESIVVVVPGAEHLPEIAVALAELVTSGAIRILDLVVMQRRPSSGDVSVLGPASSAGAPFRALRDARIEELLSARDISSAAAALLPGATGVLMLIEDRWATALSAVAVRAGGRVVGGARVPKSRIEAALQAVPVLPATAVEGTSDDTHT